jgi:hypothetical protein
VDGDVAGILSGLFATASERAREKVVLVKCDLGTCPVDRFSKV